MLKSCVKSGQRLIKNPLALKSIKQLARLVARTYQQEQLEEARSKAEAHFNQEKSSKLERIQSQGKKEMSVAEELKLDNQTERISLNGLNENLQ